LSCLDFKIDRLNEARREEKKEEKMVGSFSQRRKLEVEVEMRKLSQSHDRKSNSIKKKFKNSSLKKFRN